MAKADMQRFWDERAEEDAFYFADSRLRYGAPDLERFWRGGEEAVETTLELLEVDLPPTAEVVEIGCGPGRITRALAARAATVRAFDVSPRMLALAREHNPHLDNVEWIQGDGRTLAPIADGSADVCQSHVVFQHLPDPEITLGYVREVGRVLRAGGWAGLMVSDLPAMHRRRGGLRGAVRDLVRSGHRRPRNMGHPAWLGSAVRVEDVGNAGQEAGMKVERVVGAGTQYCMILLRKCG